MLAMDRLGNGRGAASVPGRRGTRSWRRRVAGLVVPVLLVGLMSAAAAVPGGPGSSGVAGRWIVRLADPALASYVGGIAGLAPTSPQVTGAERLDTEASRSRAYRAHLQRRQVEVQAVMGRVLGREVAALRRYLNVADAMVVEMDAAEAARIAGLPGVVDVQPDALQQLTTDVSQELIGSPAVWGGATGTGAGTRGEGVLVGMLDTGVNPDHPSFAATDADGFTHTNPFGPGKYKGVCDPAHPSYDPSFPCNDKLVGAWTFIGGSARDEVGHGSHTGSTMAGNTHDTVVTVGDTELVRTVRGVAPRANVISYKVCAPEGCPTTAILAAMDQAVADGVQVLNYSLGPGPGVPEGPWTDPTNLAFLDAFSAGVFVSASAGNSGPSASTARNTSPWNATVAASTTARIFAQSLAVTGPDPVPEPLRAVPAAPGDGRAIEERTEAEVRDAGEVDPDNELGCVSFPPAVFGGAVALVDRGVCPFSTKVNNAAAVGAVAVVVVNDVAGPPVAMGDLGSTRVRSVMIDHSSGTTLRDLLADTSGAVTVRLDPNAEVLTDPAWQDIVAGFSSRGPSTFDIPAPSITAPGVNILAAGAGAPGTAGAYAMMQGTSMAAPHVAGAGALLTALHPDWSPAEIHSALAGTANPDVLVKEDGVTPAEPVDAGSGRLDVAAAARTGVVLDETAATFAAADPAAGGDPSTLNLPALVHNQCARTCTWTRTLTSVADTEASYTVTVDAPAGVTLSVSPTTVILPPGASRQIEITADVTGSPMGEQVFGSVGLHTDAAHASGSPIPDLHLPVAVTPAQTPPAMTLNPDQVTATQGPNEVTTGTLTIGNTGDADLTWQTSTSTDAGAGAGSVAQPRLPHGETTRVRATEPEQVPTSQGAQLATRDGGDARGAVVPEQAADGAGLTVTQSRSQAITPGNSVACAESGQTNASGYLRTFTLADFGLGDGFDVSEVSFGVEYLSVAETVTVNLYTLDAQPFVYGSLTPIGTAEATLDPQTGTLVTVPITGDVPAEATLVVEVDVPDMRGSGAFVIGSNSAGQTAPSYLRAEACGAPEPVDVAALGFGGMHIVMNVTGTPKTQCQAPSGTAWADMTPTSGTVAGQSAQEVTVIFDSTGLADGEVLAANVCLVSNDPDRLFTVVPLTLTIDGDGGGEPSEGSQDIIATVPDLEPGDGSLVLSVNPEDRTVTLPELTSAGDRLATSGELRPVTVTDTRADTDPGWDASAQVGDFDSGSNTFSGGFLGWTPVVASSSDGQQVTAGERVAPGFPSGEGLSVPRVLARGQGGAGLGTVRLGAVLRLEIPTTTSTGAYTAVLTLTAI